MDFRLSAAVVASLLLAPQPFSASAQTPPADGVTAFYRNDLGHTGVTTDPLSIPLSLLWRHTTTAVRGNTASPVAAGDVVYFGSGPHVYALNAKDGRIVWQFPAAGDESGNFESTPALVDGALYVGSDGSEVYKLDAKTGAQLWSVKVGGSVRSSPVVDGGLVFFGVSDRSAYAVSADTGKVVWNASTGGSITASPTVYNGQVIFSSADNGLYAFNATSGRQAWAVHLPADSSAATPVFGDGTLYVGGGDTLYALLSRSGTERWKRKLGSDVTSAPTYADGTVYVATTERYVYALADRGHVRWAKHIDYPSYGPALLAGNILLVPTQHGVLYGLDAQTGATKWEYVVQAAGTATQPRYATTDIASAPLWTGKTLYVLSDDGTLSAFRADAVDKIAPQASDLSPAPGSIVAGVHVPYGATLVDVGSGIDPSSVVLQVDQAPVSLAKYDPSKNGVVIDLSGDTHGYSGRPLSDGSHQVTLKAKDWRGNALTKTWAFVVDNRFNPPTNHTTTVTDLTPDTQTAPQTLPTQPQTGGGVNTPAIPRSANGGRDPDGGVNGGPPPPPPIDGGGGPGQPPTQPTPPPPTPPGNPTPPTPPGAPAPPAPPV